MSEVNPLAIFLLISSGRFGRPAAQLAAARVRSI